MATVRIAIDAMGGDFAPASPVEGAVQSIGVSDSDQLQVVLVGDRQLLDVELQKHEYDQSRVQVVHAGGQVGTGESTIHSIKGRRDASMSVAIEMHGRKEVDAVVSAGHTGVQMALSVLRLGRLEGVRRPTIGAFFPGDAMESFLLDVGANTDCKPYHLVQFAAMGSIYVTHKRGIENPRIGLLSIGEEKSKGNTLTKQAHELFSVCPFNFVGNIEGRDIVRGKADVIVCDGYAGNVLLKFAETFHYLITEKLRDTLGSITTLKDMPALMKLQKDFDYQERGGVPLLGVNGVSIICHGTSSPRAICNAVLAAKQMVEDGLVQKIQQAISTYHVGIFTRSMVRLKDWRSFQEWRDKLD